MVSSESSAQTTEEPEPGSSQDISCLLRVAEAHANAEHILEDVLWRRLSTMRNRMSKLLSRSRNHDYLKAAYQVYSELYPARQARILISAEFYDCYTRIEREERSYESAALAVPSVAFHYSTLFDLLSREKAIQSLADGAPQSYLVNTRLRDVWSPVGDVAAKRDRLGRWSLCIPPMLGDVTAIDFDSPVALCHESRSGVLSQQQLDFTQMERDSVVDKLQAALRIFDELQPIFGLLIRNFVRRVVVRKSVAEEDVGEAIKNGMSLFGSEHVHRQPGSIRLLNVHLSDCTTVLCVEKLLHESTHNFLAAWETANGPFVSNDEKYRPVSPWSGNPIPNSSLVHATFIYYMCHRLFRGFLSSEHGQLQERPAQIKAKLGLFAAGFLIPQSLYDQLLLTAEPQHGVQAVLDEMQRNIKAEYRYHH